MRRRRGWLGVLAPLLIAATLQGGQLVERSRDALGRMDAAESKSEKSELGNLALELAERAVAEDPGDAEAHLSVAIALGKLSFLESPGERIRNSARIRDEAQRAVELDPDYELAWFVLGRWNYEIANLGVAAKFFAEKLFGKLPEASNERAVECLERAKALNPGLMNRAELGRAYLAVGQGNQAREELRAALAMQPSDPDEREALDRAREALKRLDAE
jgi:tetratricopeptide (TPR) repeat protein